MGVLGKKNEHLWESLEGIMVNGALGRSLEYSMYSLGTILKAPFGIVLRQNPWPHPWLEQRPITLGACGLATSTPSQVAISKTVS